MLSNSSGGSWEDRGDGKGGLGTRQETKREGESELVSERVRGWGVE